MEEIKKTYYSISEVCTKTSLEPHVLRYWESEFPSLRPKKNRAGNRAYRDKDIDLILYIKKLLYEDQFTIPGAKKKIADIRADEAPALLQQSSPALPEQNAQAPVVPSDAMRQETISQLKSLLEIITAP